MDGKSLNITEEKMNKLKEIIPEAFTEGKIDWEKLKAALGEDIEFKNERYVLNWAGKSDAFRVLQAPTTATLVPDKEESVNFDNTENVFIEGENLEVLKILQKSYFGKIKMIYIDPPYNTGNDNFIYPDKFSETKDEYLSRIGDKDETGYMTREGLFRKNSKDSGHYHSNWLSMMYPRLFLARNLLREDGVIFVSIDDNEVHNLRLMMNEVFGEENFVANFLWKKKSTTSNVEGAQVSSLMDYTLCYRKTEKAQIKQRVKPKDERRYPHSDEEGDYRLTVIEKKDSGAYKRESMKFKIIGHSPRIGKRWQIGEETARLLEQKNRFVFQDGKVKLKIYDFEDKDTFSAQPNILDNYGTTDSAAKDVNDELFGISELFDNPKPVELLGHLISISSNKGDIVCDYFSGSCSTAHAVLGLNKQDSGNRKFIMVQLPEKTDEKSEAYKAGYKTIADIGKERIRRVIKKIKEEQAGKLDLDGNAGKQDLGFKVFKQKESNFKIWRQDIKTEEELTKQMEVFTDPVDENAETENILYELLLKSGVSLTAKIEEKKGYYLANGSEIALLLEKVNEKIIKSVIDESPEKVIILDRLFKNNDQLKTNTALQMKDAGIDFKVA